MGESALVSVLRNRKFFDPELSLVAELNDSIIGHVLFIPQETLVRGEILNAVILAPLAVLPKYQKLGVGSKLIEEGHKRATQREFQFSLLLGHHTYYPRFGYRTNMFASSHAIIATKDIPEVHSRIEERRVKKRDIDELCLLWKQCYGNSHLAIVPGDSITDWISYGKVASAITIDGTLSGYIRYDANDPKKIISVLSNSSDTTNAILFLMKTKLRPEDKELLLPLQANSSFTSELLNTPYQPDIKIGNARMIKILTSNNPCITSYCNDVEAGGLEPGTVIWPVEFDVV
jgi:putative acetyltransferase